MQERAANKADRLLQIRHLLMDHPEGLTQAEIARRIGVNRSTVMRYLPDLNRFAITEGDDGRLSIDRTTTSPMCSSRFTRRWRCTWPRD